MTPHKRHAQMQRDSASQRELAEFENKLFEAYRLTVPRGEKLLRGAWLSGELGGLPTQYAWRERVRRCPRIVADALWGALDAGTLSLRKAQDIVARARREGGGDEGDFLRFVQRELAAQKAPLTNGQKDKDTPQTTLSRAFKAEIERVTDSYIARALAGTDAHAAAHVRRAFLTGVDMLMSDLRRGVTRERATAKKSARRVRRGDLEGAGLMLAMRVAWGKPADEAVAKKARQRRWFELHPDRNAGGTPEQAEQLEAVDEAYETVLAYNRQLEGKV